MLHNKPRLLYTPPIAQGHTPKRQLVNLGLFVLNFKKNKRDRCWAAGEFSLNPNNLQSTRRRRRKIWKQLASLHAGCCTRSKRSSCVCVYTKMVAARVVCSDRGADIRGAEPQIGTWRPQIGTWSPCFRISVIAVSEALGIIP
jgi:hypothetical protein